MSVLYVVATPIGNMEDLSPRAERVLREVSLIAAEDTRHTGIMLKRLGISTPLVSNHGFNEQARLGQLLEALSAGDVALVSDAGTPAISDPGAILVRAAAGAGHDVVPIPGPSAVTAAVSASGLVDGAFAFLGFLPRPVGERQAALRSALDWNIPLVIFESGNRIEAFGRQLAELAGERQVALFRELTKVHEQTIRCVAADLPARLVASVRKGEFVVVVGAGTSQAPVDLDTEIRRRLDRGGRPSEIAREIARDTGSNRSEVYDRILELVKETQGA